MTHHRVQVGEEHSHQRSGQPVAGHLLLADDLIWLIRSDQQAPQRLPAAQQVGCVCI